MRVLTALLIAATASAAHAAGGSLTGLSETEARARLGAPNLERTEGAGALWTYRLEGCALLVFLRRGQDNVLKITGAEASPRKRGDPQPETAACIQAALARKAPSSR